VGDLCSHPASTSWWLCSLGGVNLSLDPNDLIRGMGLIKAPAAWDYCEREGCAVICTRPGSQE
jgi:hypothetical protein